MDHNLCNSIITFVHLKCIAYNQSETRARGIIASDVTCVLQKSTITERESLIDIVGFRLRGFFAND